MRQLFKHEDSTVTVPERGIVLITGDNGAGKSLICEAVSIACWGKTIRGARPWPADECVVEVETELGTIRREHRGGSSTLRWGDREWPTKTKAQEELETLLGSWDDWRKTSVFHGSAAALFTLATDAERKRLIEGFLGIERFDDGLRACRGRKKGAAEALIATERTRIALKEQVAESGRSIEELQEMAERYAKQAPVKPNPRKAEGAAKRVAKIEEARVVVEKELRVARAELEQARRRGIEARVGVDSARRDLARVDKDLCGACGQPIAEALRKRARRAVTEAEDHAQTIAGAAEEREQALRERIEEGEDELVELRARHEELLKTVREFEEARRAHERFEAERGQLAARIAARKRELRERERSLNQTDQVFDERTADLRVLGAAERVLGLEGVRAQLLGQALAGIEASANTWLERVGWPGFSVELRPYAETQGGDVRDRISLTITGAGGENGYLGSSTGERRRLDIALLFALSEFAAAVRAIEPGTMFVDEILDGLDAQGTALVAEALHELAENRAIVVISHNENLAYALEPSAHLHVVEGSIDARQ